MPALQVNKKKEYIKQLSNSFSYTPSKQEQAKLLKSKSKKDINLFFYNVLKNTKEQNSTNEEVNKLKIKSQDKAAKILDRKITLGKNKLIKLTGEINKLQENLVSLTKEKNKLVNVSSEDIRTQVNKILEQKIWGNLKTNHDGDIILLETLNDVVCQHIDKKVKVNLGKLLARVDLNTMNIRIFKSTSFSDNVQVLLRKNYEDSTEYEKYLEEFYEKEDNGRWHENIIHPYVQSENNTICWGNATTTISQLKTQFQIEKIFQFLNALFATDSGGGYYSILDVE